MAAHPHAREEQGQRCRMARARQETHEVRHRTSMGCCRGSERGAHGSIETGTSVGRGTCSQDVEDAERLLGHPRTPRLRLPCLIWRHQPRVRIPGPAAFFRLLAPDQCAQAASACGTRACCLGSAGKDLRGAHGRVLARRRRGGGVKCAASELKTDAGSWRRMRWLAKARRDRRSSRRARSRLACEGVGGVCGVGGQGVGGGGFLEGIPERE